MGGFFHGPGGHTEWGRAGQEAGVRFAGVPPEMRPGVERLLRGEPEHPVPDLAFSHLVADTRPLTLGRLLRPAGGAIAVGVLLVIVETLALQAGPLLTQRAIDDGMLARDMGVVAVVAAAYLAAVVVNGLAGAARVSWAGRLGQRLMYDLRVRIFTHLQRQSVEFFTDEKTGRIITRMTSDVEALADVLQDGIINLLVQGLTLVVVAIALLSMDSELALIVLLAIIPALALMTVRFGVASERSYREVRDRIADVLSDLAEGLSGIRVAAAYNRQGYNEVHHRNIAGDYRQANERAARAASLYGPGTDAVGTLGQALVLAIGGSMVLRGDLSVGELVAFLLYLTAFFAPIQHLAQLYNTYQSGQAGLAKIRELLAVEPSVAERPGAIDLPPVAGEITFDHVSFAYRPGQPVLDDISLTVRPGETVALVGITGGGKSTLAKLVMRLYDPTAGRVLVDGHDLRDVTFASLRRQLGVVPQEPFLFAGTVRDNLAFARPGATTDEIEAACRAVGLDAVLDRLPGGLGAHVHERGSSLSAGERQLLALARALVAGPRILVLDEATSNLDLRSEAIVDDALDRARSGRTAVIIAHRLSTAMRADRIAVIDAGRLVEVGTHDELLARRGTYWRLATVGQAAVAKPDG
ncbi:MAG: ABC transporter ATP-binding protein [Acidimicrobiales bacterium]